MADGYGFDPDHDRVRTQDQPKETAMNIVFVASEAAPLAKTGGLADVVGSLPHALKKLGHDVQVIMPYYRQQIAASGIKVQAMQRHIPMLIDGLHRLVPLHKAEVHGLRFVLVEQDDLFDRDGLYGSANGEYIDNPLRFILLCRIALDAACLDEQPVDLFHCHDWQTGLLPLLLNEQYRHRPQLTRTRTVFTIHNLAYQGIFPALWMHRLGLPSSLFHPGALEFYGQINCMKAGIMASDQITTVSPSYAGEILTSQYGCNLEGFLQTHAHKLTGIVNGLDVDGWNPATDSGIASTFRAAKPQGKLLCKRALQAKLGMDQDDEVPLLAVISRLAGQKGVDLITENIPAWMKSGYQLAVLGSGDTIYERRLQDLAKKHPRQMSFYCGFNENLARGMYAGSDLFLMPSRFEPCGLSQLIAMRYGSIPVVRATGGLKDTVVDYNQSPAKATGFSFSDDLPLPFHAEVEHAASLFRKKAVWTRIRGRAMRRDSSWDLSAESYTRIYRSR